MGRAHKTIIFSISLIFIYALKSFLPDAKRLSSQEHPQTQKARQKVSMSNPSTKKRRARQGRKNGVNQAMA